MKEYVIDLVDDYWQVTCDGILFSTHSLWKDAEKAVRQYKTGDWMRQAT